MKVNRTLTTANENNSKQKQMDKNSAWCPIELQNKYVMLNSAHCCSTDQINQCISSSSEKKTLNEIGRDYFIPAWCVYGR